MNLLDFIKRLDREGTDDFARRCGTTAGQLRQVAYGHRRASASLAILVDRESKGVVRCEDLRPDIDWQYLRDSCLREAAA